MKPALALLQLTLAFPLTAWAQPLPEPTRPARPAASSETSAPALYLALTSTSAFGVTHAGFFNQLLGARAEYRFTSRFAFGGTLSYASLEGRERRVHNVLPELRLSYRLPVYGRKLSVPLHFSPGYLAQNGPTLRLGAGLAVALSDGITLELSPLEPMVWVTRERPEVSLDLSAALSASF
jgi:hypothetical protein